jgi:glycolate oxidase FAD binding subunit
MNAPVCQIDGFGPLPMLRPATVAELGEIVATASADGSALYPVGGQTQLGLGNPPIKTGSAVDLRGLDQVIDFPARDMTITVQAGITVARLQGLLAPENLRLPIEVPASDCATLGGSIAANVSGPRRYGFGTLRDYVIGISAVNDGGREFKAGGRVVKNVAGYDLCKLLVGSLGTLGIITQVTLKLRPLPEEQALISLGCASDGLDALLDLLHATRTRPVLIELLNRPAAAAVFRRIGQSAPDAAWTAVVGYEGNADAVHWQVQHLIKEVGAANQLEARVAFTARPLWDALIDGTGGNEAVVRFKANMLPSVVAAFCRSADRDPDRPVLQAHAGSGVVYGHWDDSLSQARATELRAAWRAEAQRGQGGVVVKRCPPAWKQALPVWESLPGGWLMRQVKEQFDPRRVFNPGRFVEGI